MSEIDQATFDELKQISGEDFIDELIDTFLEDAPNMIAEMKSALEDNDADIFRRAAHSMKSNAATFGAIELAELAKDLEMLGKENKLGETGDKLKSMEDAYASAKIELEALKSA
ncbi:MAG TPA: Hpt domain-containing protein [Anaerolineales bacterium]|nr:Hpt domain-containing protein [Anaerolineales bacterium]